MFQKNIAFYLGQEKSDGFSGFIAEGNLFLIIEIEEGLENKEGHKTLTTVKEDLIASTIDSLASFDLAISETVKKNNLPVHLSLASGYLRNDVLYLKTIGAGEVFIHRRGEFAKIISGTQNASGYVEKGDSFIFTTHKFIQLFAGEGELKKIFDHKNPHEIVEAVTPSLKSKDDQGTIALFAQFEEETIEEAMFISQENIWQKILGKIGRIYNKIQAYTERSGRKKTSTLIAVIVIFVILIWSVGLGYQRRTESSINNKISSARQLIKQKLLQADEVAFLNLSRSLVLINEAKSEVNKLKKEVGNKRTKDIDELVAQIAAQENKIIKKEEKTYEEFFDLTIDNKKAQGSRLYLDRDGLAIFDKTQGIIYSLSLTKKSLDKKSFNEIKRSQLLASYQDELIFYVVTDGLYKIDSEGKLKRVVEKDKDWGNIVDLWIYNGNIYLLDEKGSEIYKYLVAEGGYSAKTSYFKGGTFGLKDANSLAIDSSVYVGFADNIFKFTAGVQEDFKTSWPETNVAINKIFTSKDVEKVYAWDKTKGAIYILGKNGTYEREINSNVLSKANDFAIYGTAAYVLVGPKIYKINLD